MNKQGAHILVIDDEVEIVRALTRGLTAYGYKVFTARNGKDALKMTFQQRPDLLLLDMVLPDMSGIDVCRDIREKSNVPIIILSVKEAEHDKVLALDKGADDYIAKPFGIQEVQARIRVALRHAAKIETGTEPYLQVGPLRVDFERRKVFVSDKEVKLTPTEYNLIRTFLMRRGKIMTRQMLVSQLWSSEEVARTHSLHVYIAQLRQKIEPDPNHPVFILTIPGVGYRFNDDWE